MKDEKKNSEWLREDCLEQRSGDCDHRKRMAYQLRLYSKDGHILKGIRRMKGDGESLVKIFERIKNVLEGFKEGEKGEKCETSRR